MGERVPKRCCTFIEGRLYFAILRNAQPQQTAESHYFSIENELFYEPFFADFGPLHLGNLYRFCMMLNHKLNSSALAGKKIYFYANSDKHNQANAAYLIGCYAVLYLDYTPDEAQNVLAASFPPFFPFRDASYGVSTFDLTVYSCFRAVFKARELGWLNFETFNCEEYEFYERVENGDFNWIVPGKFLAFSGPHENATYTQGIRLMTPEDYHEYFLKTKIGSIIRLNQNLYNKKRFTDVGFKHFDLYYLDGSNPPDHLLAQFIEICEAEPNGIAVHCKAGLGRTGTCIGVYLMKHFNLTAEEAIAWMRICRPGSVIGPQQQYLQQAQSKAWKQGVLYRRKHGLPPPLPAAIPLTREEVPDYRADRAAGRHRETMSPTLDSSRDESSASPSSSGGRARLGSASVGGGGGGSGGGDWEGGSDGGGSGGGGSGGLGLDAQGTPPPSRRTAATEPSSPSPITSTKRHSSYTPSSPSVYDSPAYSSAYYSALGGGSPAVSGYSSSFVTEASVDSPTSPLASPVMRGGGEASSAGRYVDASPQRKATNRLSLRETYNLGTPDSSATDSSVDSQGDFLRASRLAKATARMGNSPASPAPSTPSRSVASPAASPYGSSPLAAPYSTSGVSGSTTSSSGGGGGGGAGAGSGGGGGVGGGVSSSSPTRASGSSSRLSSHGVSHYVTGSTTGSGQGSQARTSPPPGSLTSSAGGGGRTASRSSMGSPSLSSSLRAYGTTSAPPMHSASASSLASSGGSPSSRPSLSSSYSLRSSTYSSPSATTYISTRPQSATLSSSTSPSSPSSTSTAMDRALDRQRLKEARESRLSRDSARVDARLRAAAASGSLSSGSRASPTSSSYATAQREPAGRYSTSSSSLYTTSPSRNSLYRHSQS